MFGFLKRNKDQGKRERVKAGEREKSFDEQQETAEFTESMREDVETRRLQSIEKLHDWFNENPTLEVATERRLIQMLKEGDLSLDEVEQKLFFIRDQYQELSDITSQVFGAVIFPSFTDVLEGSEHNVDLAEENIQEMLREAMDTERILNRWGTLVTAARGLKFVIRDFGQIQERKNKVNKIRNDKNAA
jgi:hypothetical protein